MSSSIIGVGSFSTVRVLTQQPPNRHRIAVKSIEDCLVSTTTTTQLHQLLRELIVLRTFGHPNLVAALSVTPHSNGIHIHMLASDCDLFALMKTPRTAAVLTHAHIQFIQYQILSGMRYLHANDVIHRDLNPRNIFVNHNGAVQIGDFGLCCVCATKKRPRRGGSGGGSGGDGGPQKTSTVTDDDDKEDALRWRMLRVSNIASTPYTAPEILLDKKKCSKASDVWSAGVVLCEMLLIDPLTGKRGEPPLFPALRRGGGGSDRGRANDIVATMIAARGGPTEVEDKVWSKGGCFSKRIRDVFDQELSKARGTWPRLSLRCFAQEKENQGNTAREGGREGEKKGEDNQQELFKMLLALGKEMLSYNHKDRIAAEECLLEAVFNGLQPWTIGGGGKGGVFVASGKRIPVKERQRLFRYELERNTRSRVKKGEEKQEEERIKETLRSRIQEYMD